MAAVDSREESPSSRCGHSDADSQSQQGSYITVIPVDYTRSRTPYPTPATDYLVDQYSEYLRERARDEYLRGDYNINSDPQYEEAGPMYALSQRYAAAAEPITSYSSLAQDREWEPRSMAQSTNQVVPQSQMQQHQEQMHINEQLAAKQSQQQQQQHQPVNLDKVIPPVKKSNFHYLS
jgi:hypothetical protein